jgi:NAD(P)-dependent dehydrogenase (short-subunit alcohol dehydrogenase family)
MKVISGFSLVGKTALVTGATRGIGKAIALRLAGAGADLILVSRKIGDLEKVSTEIKDSGRKSWAIAANMSKKEEIKNLGEKIKNLGGIDILVNNAGGSPGITKLMDMDEALWETVLNLNLNGPVLLSSICAKMMADRGGGSIINISSIYAFRPDPDCPPYSVAKAGLLMATKSMAREWAEHNIRVNAIAPGNIHTRLGDSRFTVIPGLEHNIISRTPLKRLGKPEEIAGATLYLASDAASFVTGTTMIIDGGMLLT